MKKSYTLFILFLSFSAAGQLCDPNTYSLKFDGLNDYVSTSSNNDLDLTTVVTLEAWIKAFSWAATPAQGSIICKHGWTLGEQGYVLRAGGDGQLSFNISALKNNGTPEGWKEVVSTPGSMELNIWYHVAGVYDGHQLKIYINGNLAGSKSFKGGINPSISYNLKIGRIADNGASDGRYWNGLIDEVRVWNTVRSEGDIFADMDNHVSSTSNNLAGYWKLNESIGTIVVDNGSGNNEGTIHNAARNTDVPFTNSIPRPIIYQAGSNLISNALSGNQWNLNGIQIPGETGMSIIPHMSGIYSVTVNFGLGCIATSEPFEIIITGINDLQSTQISVGENAIDHIVFISGPADIINKSYAKLFDLNGKIIKSINCGELGNQIKFDALSGGIYLFVIGNEDTYLRYKIVFK